MTPLLTGDGAAPLWPVVSILIQIVGSLAPVATAVVAFVAYRALKQRATSDDRAAWWDRASKSLDLLASEDLSQINAGMVMVDHLTDSPLATTEDRQMFLDVVNTIIDHLILSAEKDNRRSAKAQRMRRPSRPWWRPGRP